MNPPLNNPELETVLQSFLMRKAKEWQEYVKEYPELLKFASYHIAPDGAWIAIEHEETQGTHGAIFRKSPACTTTITKL